MALIQKLDPKSLEAFNVASKKKFSEQAIFFLNAFWDEYGDQAEYIYTVAYEYIRLADMRLKGINYIHQYDEGCDLDFDMTLYFFEQMWNYVFEKGGQKWQKSHKKSCPQELTAIVRKKEFRDKVDVNFDGRVSFLEYLLYQYKCSPKLLMDRSEGCELPEEVKRALAALEEVNKRIRAYEAEKARLEKESKLDGGKGIKALKACAELAQLNCSPLWESLNKALITAEAAVRIASRKYGIKAPLGLKAGEKPKAEIRCQGAMWWMNKDLEEKKKKYGKPPK